MADTPGTVSRILWHFTGRPKWNAAENRQENIPKPANEAYEAFLSILRSKQLRIGQYREVVKVRVPKLQKYNREKRRVEEQTNVLIELRSSPVCCLADIPITHLSYHAQRYGKFAIGFHRDAAVQHGFNPVFYTLYDTTVLKSLYDGFAQLRNVDVNAIEYAAEDVETEVQGLECEHGHEVEVDLSSAVDNIQSEAQWVGNAVEAAQDSFERFLAFVKTFDQDEFATIYCEREWRSVELFPFRFDHVAMVVLPRSDGKRSYFDKFISDGVRRLKFPRSIPVVPWEDLVEH